MCGQTKQDGAFPLALVFSGVIETLTLFSDRSSSVAWLELLSLQRLTPEAES